MTYANTVRISMSLVLTLICAWGISWTGCSKSPPAVPGLAAPSVADIGKEIQVQTVAGHNANEKTAKQIEAMAAKAPEVKPEATQALLHNREQNVAFFEIEKLTAQLKAAQKTIDDISVANGKLATQVATLQEESNKKERGWLLAVKIIAGVAGFAMIFCSPFVRLPLLIPGIVCVGVAFAAIVMGWMAQHWWIPLVASAAPVLIVGWELIVNRRAVSQIVKTNDLANLSSYQPFIDTANEIQTKATQKLVDIAQGKTIGGKFFAWLRGLGKKLTNFVNRLRGRTV